MRRLLLAAVFLGLGMWYAVQSWPTAEAQPPAPILGGAPDAAGARAQRPQAYPDRPKAPQAKLDSGKALYGVSCAFCHGSDAGGGEGGPNLLRSGVVLQDDSGEAIAPIVHGARVDKGMPRIDLTDAQIGDIAAWLHSLHVASRTDADASINILTGDAAAGQAAFQKTCASCHSVTGDLQGFATKVPVPKTLQQTWMLPGGAGGRGGGPGAGQVPGLRVPPTTVTVTLPSGQKIDGVLTRIDDFYVGLRQADGTVRGFSRVGDKPGVVLHDPLAAHRELLRTYTDTEIHNITAYLVTLK